jgi:solute carrier family 6 GABA transporter-like protein 1
MRIAVLPWGSCDNWWNTETCVSAYSRQNLTSYVEGNTTFYNLNGTMFAAANLTDPVKEYWEYVK